MVKYTRICPSCNKEVVHKTKAIRDECENKKCRSCTAIEINSRPGLRDDFVTKYGSVNKSGDKNPFFGKKHTEESLEKIREAGRNAKYTKERRDRLSQRTKGKGNPMYGKTVYQVWVEKYGEERAKELDSLRREKFSKNSSGKNNPMYGKPAPQGSGNGWSGWYKGWYFRSLRELSFVINVLEANNQNWSPAEKYSVKIPYKSWNGESRTYVPDFLVINSPQWLLIEIKPKNLIDSPTVKLKQLAAQEYCKTKDWKYEIVDPEILTNEEIKLLHEGGKIKFLDKYEKMYHERYKC